MLNLFDKSRYRQIVVVSMMAAFGSAVILNTVTIGYANDAMTVKPFYEKPDYLNNDDVIQNTLSGLPSYMGGYSQAAGGGYTQQAQPLPEEFLVPENTVVTGTLKSALNSNDTAVGDQFEIVTTRDIQAKSGVVLLPAGSHVVGKVTDVSSSGYPRRKAKMECNFFEVVTPAGRKFAINAEINNRGGKLKGNKRDKSKKRSTSLTIAQSALGMGARMVGGPVGGIGVKAGMFLLAKKGKDIILNPGDAMEIRLEEPVTRASLVYDPAPAFTEKPYVPAVAINVEKTPSMAQQNVQPKSAYTMTDTERVVSIENSIVPVNYTSSEQWEPQGLSVAPYEPYADEPAETVQVERRINIDGNIDGMSQ